MFISKFSHLGARVVKRLITAPLVSAPRTTYSYAVQDRNLQSLMHERFFSTTDRAQEKGSEENQKISVTFVGSDGEEMNIKVPIGMSMLEAAHENDIELEGGSKIYALGASIGPTVGVDILLAARDHITQHGNLKFATAHSRACEGSLAWSTCHVIVMDMEYYNKLEDPSDEENDMLDLAFGLTETSRLGCQVIAKPELDGLRLALPAATRNFAVDGYKPKPH